MQWQRLYANYSSLPVKNRYTGSGAHATSTLSQRDQITVIVMTSQEYLRKGENRIHAFKQE